MVDPIKAEHLVEEPHKIGPKALGVVLSHQYLIKSHQYKPVQHRQDQAGLDLHLAMHEALSPLAFKSRMAKKNATFHGQHNSGLWDFPWKKASTKRNNNMQPLMPDRSSYSVPNFSVQSMLLQAPLHTTSQAPLPQVPLLFHPGADLAEAGFAACTLDMRNDTPSQ